MSEEPLPEQDSPAKEESDPKPLPSEQAPHYRLVYSNAVNMYKTAWDFRFDFGTLQGGTAGRPLLNQEQVSVVMSPQHAKVFTIIALGEIKKWEDKFGEIKLSEAVIKAFNLPDLEIQVIEKPEDQ